MLCLLDANGCKCLLVVANGCTTLLGTVMLGSAWIEHVFICILMYDSHLHLHLWLKAQLCLTHMVYCIRLMVVACM